MVKETGKVLSTNDYTNEDVNTVSELRSSGWVRPVEGKDLSTEDFTTELKNKLDGIATQANKTEITSTITSDTDKVPSCAAVSAFVDSKIPSTIDVTSSFAISDDDVTVNLQISSQEENICFVRVTELSTSRVVVNSYTSRGVLNNTRSLTVSNLNSDSLGYIVEVWKAVNDQPVLVKTFHTKQS